MHKGAMKCNETVGKWCKNMHGASKIIYTLETYQSLLEWIGLGCIIWLVLWAVGGIVPIILVLVAGDVGDILLDI
jgi:hypothetical protein